MTRYFLGDEIAEWLHIPRNPGQDEMLALSWAWYVQAEEAALKLPASGEVYWAIDEILRQGVLYFLSVGEPQYIEIPDTNNPNFESGEGTYAGGKSKTPGRRESARVRKAANGNRRLELGLRLKERHRVEAELVRGDRTLASARRPLETGDHTVRMRLAKSIDPGPARLLVNFTNGSGAKETVSRRISLPANG